MDIEITQPIYAQIEKYTSPLASNNSVGKFLQSTAPIEQIQKPSFDRYIQPFKKSSFSVIQPPKEWQPALDDSYHYYPDVPKGLVETTLMMESSMGQNNANEKKDYGKYGWIAGHTKDGIFQDSLKQMEKNPNLRKKMAFAAIPGMENLATPYAAIQATSASLAKLIRNNPEMSLEDIYFKLYVTAPESDTPKRREQFQQALASFSQ